MKVRRRVAVAATGATCMALLAAPAMAGTKTYAGKTDGGGFVGADVVIKDGKPKMIKAGSRVTNLPG